MEFRKAKAFYGSWLRLIRYLNVGHGCNFSASGVEQREQKESLKNQIDHSVKTVKL